MAVFNSQNGRANSASAAAANPAAGESVASAQVTLPGQAQRSVMVLGKTLSFKGELSAEEDLILFGRVEGSVKHTENLTIGVGGVVIGDVKARVITVKGTVEGDLEATESIVVSPTANVIGDLVAPRVSVVEGATFNGAVRMPKTAGVDAAKAAPATDGVLADKTVDKMLGG
ncbi:MAG TPA: polymer-forming cytoskeletal protein [Steroidobacteraceae bacterium]|nr:polymer-forming cytoskeletal protein [Steroidobacteraceae bacterium]